MPDILIHHIDSLMAERIKSLAKQRQWSINDVMLNALRHGLGMNAAGHIFTETMLDPGNLVLGGHWDAQEKAVFQEAVQALAVAGPAPLAAAAGEC